MMLKLQKLWTTLSSNGVDKLNIQGNLGNFTDNANLDPVSNGNNIFRDHPSIIKEFVLQNSFLSRKVG